MPLIRLTVIRFSCLLDSKSSGTDSHVQIHYTNLAINSNFEEKKNGKKFRNKLVLKSYIFVMIITGFDSCFKICMNNKF